MRAARIGLAAAVGLSLVSGAATAAEYMHCYLREAPDDALISSEYNVSALLDALPIASLKHACGLGTPDDEAMLNKIVAAGQCTPESEIAGFVSETFEMAPEEMHAGLTKESSEAVMTAVCEAAKSCEPGEGGYSEACEAAIDTAMGG